MFEVIDAKKRCPKCRTNIPLRATVCPNCQSNIGRLGWFWNSVAWFGQLLALGALIVAFLQLQASEQLRAETELLRTKANLALTKAQKALDANSELVDTVYENGMDSSFANYVKVMGDAEDCLAEKAKEDCTHDISLGVMFFWEATNFWVQIEETPERERHMGNMCNVYIGSVVALNVPSEDSEFHKDIVELCETF